MTAARPFVPGLRPTILAAVADEPIRSRTRARDPGGTISAFLELVGVPFIDKRSGAPDSRYLSMALEVFQALVRAARAEATAMAADPSEVHDDARMLNQRVIAEMHETLHSVSAHARALVWLVDVVTDAPERFGDEAAFLRSYATSHINSAFSGLDLAIVRAELARARSGKKTSKAVAAVLSRSVGLDASKGSIAHAFDAPKKTPKAKRKRRPL